MKRVEMSEELVYVLERLTKSKLRNVRVLAAEALEHIASEDCSKRAAAANAAMLAIRMMSARMRRAIGEERVRRAYEEAERIHREAKKCKMARNPLLIFISS